MGVQQCSPDEYILTFFMKMNRLFLAAAVSAMVIMTACKSSLQDDHTYTNALINESSPYLLQHAHNPVNWYPWGEEALAKAKAEDKLLIISVGYAACHWCHVMEHESFEDTTVARIMNENFVSIKVDREERPDVDDVYMTACQLATRGGPAAPLLPPHWLAAPCCLLRCPAGTKTSALTRLCIVLRM